MHLMGLLSNYNSGHASPDHFMALIKLLQQHRVKPVYLHFFTDGRDSAKYDAIKFLGEARKRLKNKEIIATICGRLYSMDRKKEWSRTDATYNLLRDSIYFTDKNGTLITAAKATSLSVRR